MRPSIKPDAWNIHPALTHPRWGWFWRGYIDSFPFFRGYAGMRLARAPTLVQTPQFVDSGAGVGVEFTTSVEEYIGVGTNIASALSAAGNYTILAFVQHDGGAYRDAANGGTIYIDTVAGGAAGINFGMPDNADVVHQTAAQSLTLNFTAAMDIVTPTLLAARREGSTQYIWAENRGGFLSTSGAGSTIGGTLSPNRIGCYWSGAFPLGTGRPLYYLHFLPRAISQDEFRMLASDPFGPYRFARDDSALARRVPPSGAPYTPVIFVMSV